MPVAGKTAHVRPSPVLDRGRPITVRLRGKSCLARVIRHGAGWEKGSSGVTRDGQAANPSAGGCGVEDQVGRAGSMLSPRAHSPSSTGTWRYPWTWSSPDGTVELSERFRSHVDREARAAREARPPHHPRPGRGREGTQPAPGGPRRAVELTAFSKGPVIRAEAAAEDKMGALDLALDKMAAQMRRAADRRREHQDRSTTGSRRPAGRAHRRLDGAPDADAEVVERQVGPISVTGDGPLVRPREDPRRARP